MSKKMPWERDAMSGRGQGDAMTLGVLWKGLP